MERGRTTRLESGLEWIVIALTASLAVLVVVGVLFRKIGGALVWYDEVASVMLAWLTYYGAALAAFKRSHIGFPRFVERASDRWFRPLVLLRGGIVITFFLLTAWAGWQVLAVLSGDHLVSLPWVPTRFTQSVIPIGAVLFAIAEGLVVRDRLAERSG